MAWLGSIGRAGGLLSLLLLAALHPVAGQQPDAGAPGEGLPPHEKGEFAGTWDYNADESINIQTGRPEQRPRSATQRGSTPGVLTPARGGRGSGSGALGPAGAGPSGMSRGTGVGPTPEMVRESRDMARDLLEVSERLKIAVGPESVTISDDLDRHWTYATDGRKERHQIAASRFEVRTEWKDSQLRQQIEGAFDFKMSQTYFLGPDGRRLFVIVRVGEPRRNAPQAGFDRVYDRVD